ncbi:MAG TPA: peroxiredoxin [Steroidobacteraceae bacterium]|jgi:thioredoxin-dependent peroxiredoxin|nr:peroxiredoxin [Steroidobacteraceae bacterium]
MLREGARAPEFTLPDQDEREVSLSSLLGPGALVLYFYPADFTPGCTREACMIRDLHPQLEESGLAAVGVSPQKPATHRAFREKYRLPFPLLSDCDKSVARMYEVVGPLGIGVRRATFLIDRGRIIRDVVRADFRIGKHEAFIRSALAARGR